MSVTRRFFGQGLVASIGAGLITFLPYGGRAAGLQAPSGKPILKISGAISVHNIGEEAAFDRPMLEALGWSSFRTRTPWYDNPVLFEGVLMTTVLRMVAASGDNVIVTALNDYVTQIPVSDFSRYGVLLALKRDGKYMPVSDKGPLFIVYPYDSDPELQRQTYYSRSAWQVAEIQVV